MEAGAWATRFGFGFGFGIVIVVLVVVGALIAALKEHS